MSELYFSVDVETDGPIPGPSSLLSLGAAAFHERHGMVSTFTANLELLDGATPDPDTMAWWATQPEEWAAHRQDLVSPAEAMASFASWVRRVAAEHAARPVFVGYPASFDFLFVYWYLIKFLGPGQSPFSFSALDIKTFAMSVLGLPYRQVTKKTLRAFLPAGRPHTHVALDDAIEQGQLFLNLLAASKRRGGER